MLAQLSVNAGDNDYANTRTSENASAVTITESGRSSTMVMLQVGAVLNAASALMLVVVMGRINRLTDVRDWLV